MTRVWYCANCGYEVHSRGRCHACRAKLTPSALPELETASEDEEVAYRIDGWADRDRGQLIVRLNDLGVEHRFEDDELVIEASDEERVDDLVAVLGDAAGGSPAGALEADGVEVSGADAWAAVAEAAEAGEFELDDLDGSDGGGPAEDWSEADDDFSASVRLLADAATRLRTDPTDMQADADVAEASAGVFMADRYGPFDEEEWSAVGRVTRRLLAALGADEALEEDIRREAGALEKLLAPLRPGGEGAALEGRPAAPGERTVYELADWLPDQRAALGFLLEDAGIAYDWEGDELLVPSDREDEVEDLFDRVGGSAGGEEVDEEAQYHAVAELFAACGRLVGDPTDPARRDAALRWIAESEGPPLLGMDEVDWFRIRSRARTLAGSIEEDRDPDEVFQHASQLHDLLRSVV